MNGKKNFEAFLPPELKSDFNRLVTKEYSNMSERVRQLVREDVKRGKQEGII